MHSEHEPWRGIHLLPSNNDDIASLMKEIHELVNLGINILIIEVDYNYAYSSHPELRGPDPITLDHARALVEECRVHGIRLIPQFQCLGHQS